MAALSAGTSRRMRGAAKKSRYPVNAASQIWKGGLVAVDSTGNAVAATDSATDLGVVGVADEDVLGGSSDGDTWVTVLSAAEWLFVTGTVAQTDLRFVEMQVVTDNTIDLAAVTTNDVACGYIGEFVSTTSVWLWIPHLGIAA